MILLPCGENGVLVELDDGTERRRLDSALRNGLVPGITEGLIIEQVPATRTVLVKTDNPQAVVDALRGIDIDSLPEADEGSAEEVTIPVSYDGEDLAEVAALLGITPAEVVERHTGQVWTVEFSGFAPGFGYLLGEHNNLAVPRRSSPRTRIPPGAVGLAGDFSGVYPKASPGGWQLIGRTEVAMWDPDRDEPALLAPGKRVRFVPVDAQAAADVEPEETR